MKEVLPKRILVFCYLHYLYTLFALKKDRKIIDTLNKLEKITNITNAFKNNVNLLKNVCVFFNNREDYRKELKYLKVLLKIHQDNKNEGEIWRTEAGIAHLYIIYLGRYKEGLSILKKYESKNNYIIYQDMGIAYYNLGEKELAKKYSQKAINTLHRERTYIYSHLILNLIELEEKKIDKIIIHPDALKEILENKVSFIPLRYKFILAFLFKNREAAKRFLREAKGINKIKYYYLYLKTFNKFLLYILIFVIILVLIGVRLLINLLIRRVYWRKIWNNIMKKLIKKKI